MSKLKDKTDLQIIEYKETSIEDHHDAFMWAYALWYWLSHNHEGQFSDKYRAMNIADTYKMTNIPDIDFDKAIEYDIDDEDENEQAIMNYHEITEDNWNDIYNEFCHYMDNDWNDDE